VSSRHGEVYNGNRRLHPWNPCHLEVEEVERSSPIDDASRDDCHCVWQSADRLAARPHIGIGIGRGITWRILNDGLNCITTLYPGNFQSDSRHSLLRYHSSHEAIAKGAIEINYVAGTEMLADALTNALGGV